MSKTALTTGVAVITLTAKVYEGRVITTYGTRKHFKEMYEKQNRAEHKNADKITCRAMIKTMECDVLLNGGE